MVVVVEEVTGYGEGEVDMRYGSGVVTLGLERVQDADVNFLFQTQADVLG